MAIVYHTLRPGTIAQPHPDRHKMAQTTKGGVLYCGVSGPGIGILSFHHRGLLLLAAAVAVMLFFLYGCVGRGGVQPPGAAGVHPSRTGFRQ